jgi:hypothetical protein
VLKVVAVRSQKATPSLLADAFQPTQRAAVEVVSIEVRPAFDVPGSDYLPKARGFIGPFHVVSHANAAVDQICST